MHTFTFPFAFILPCCLNQFTDIIGEIQNLYTGQTKLEYFCMFFSTVMLENHYVPSNERILYKHTLVFSNQVSFQHCFAAWEHSNPTLSLGSGLAGFLYHQTSSPMKTGCRVYSEILYTLTPPIFGGQQCLYISYLYYSWARNTLT